MSGTAYLVTANCLNLRGAPTLEAAVVATLSKGQAVSAHAGGSAPDGWWQVDVPAEGLTGYVARRYLASVDGSSSSVLPGINETIWRLTQVALAAHVRYQLGAKHSATGVIDCSGWVCETTQATFDAINKAATPTTVFHQGDYLVLDSYSDAIITAVEARTGVAIHGRDVVPGALREGMLIGINNGDEAWEKGGPRRVYGINHIVQVVRDEKDGALCITQSSGSGHGVNVVPLDRWLDWCRARDFFNAGRIHAVDPFAMADTTVAFPNRVAATPAAVPASPRQATHRSFRGRGVYIYTLDEILSRYGSFAGAITEMRRCRFDHAWVRIHGRGYIGDTAGADPALAGAFIEKLRAAGFAVAGWGWCQGDDPAEDAKLATEAVQRYGLDAYVADVEQQVNGASWTTATVHELATLLRPQIKSLGLSSHGFIPAHDPSLFINDAATFDCVNPQAYWYTGYPSQRMLDTVHAPAGQYTTGDPASYAALCCNCWSTAYARPIVVTGQACPDVHISTDQATAKLKSFVAAFRPDTSVIGCNFWHFGSMTRAMRDVIADWPWAG